MSSGPGDRLPKLVILPFRFDTLFPGPLSESWLNFYEWVAKQIAPSPSSFVLPKDCNDIPVPSEKYQAGAIHGAVNGIVTGASPLKQGDAILFDFLVRPYSDETVQNTARKSFFEALARKLNNFVGVTLVYMGALNPSLEHDVFLKPLRYCDTSNLYFLDWFGSVRRDAQKLELLKTLPEFQAQYRNARGVSAPEYSIRTKTIVRSGHFQIDDQWCTDRFFDAHYARYDISDWIIERYPANKTTIVYPPDDTAWMRVVVADLEREYTCVSGDAIDSSQWLDDKQVLVVLSVYDSGATLKTLCDKILKKYPGASIKAVAVISTKETPQLRGIWGRDISIDYITLRERVRTRMGGNGCIFCWRGIPATPKRTADEPEELPAHVMWQAFQASNFMFERNVTPDRLPHDTLGKLVVPNFAELVRQFGPWLAYKLEKRIRQSRSTAETTPVAVVLPKDEEGSKQLAECLRSLMPIDLLPISRQIINVVPLRKTSQDEMKAEVSRACCDCKKELGELVSKLERVVNCGADAILLDGFNVSGVTRRKLINLVESLCGQPPKLAVSICDFVPPEPEGKVDSVPVYTLYHLPVAPSSSVGALIAGDDQAASREQDCRYLVHVVGELQKGCRERKRDPDISEGALELAIGDFAYRNASLAADSPKTAAHHLLDLLTAFVPAEKRSDVRALRSYQTLIEGCSMSNDIKEVKCIVGIIDFVSSTELLMKDFWTSPEERAYFLKGIVDRITLAINELGGTPISFTGDGLLFYINADQPMTGRSISYRLKKLRLEIQTFVAEDPTFLHIVGSLKVPEFRIALDAGKVFSGKIGPGPNIIGLPIVRAARLCAKNDLYGNVVVLTTSEARDVITNIGLGRAGDFSPLGEHEIRNFGKLEIFGING